MAINKKRKRIRLPALGKMLTAATTPGLSAPAALMLYYWLHRIETKCKKACKLLKPQILKFIDETETGVLVTGNGFNAKARPVKQTRINTQRFKEMVADGTINRRIARQLRKTAPTRPLTVDRVDIPK